MIWMNDRYAPQVTLLVRVEDADEGDLGKVEPSRSS